jgi:hypothetical protein
VESYRIHLTIGGSCEKATGTFKVTEWCEGVDETYNASVARVKGSWSGRIEGGSLQISFKSDPSPHNSTGSTGGGSCSVKADGTLSCRSVPCGSADFKK